MASASDVPGKYDVVINGKGYVLLDALQPNVPFRVHRAVYSYTDTFLERTNVTGAYGDDQQSFWMTVAQTDWSLGEEQKFFRTSDADKSRQFWLGQNVNVQVPGQVTINKSSSQFTFTQVVKIMVGNPRDNVIYAAGSANLYEYDSSAAATDRGAHGVGAAPTAAAFDGSFVYLSAGAGTKVRKYDIVAHTFADFSAQVADSLVYLNNTLYGVKDNVFYTYDTAGTATATFTFKTATGAALVGTMKVVAYGGKVIILRTSGTTNGAELWQYDGIGVSKLCEFPPNMSVSDITVASGLVWVYGTESAPDGITHASLWYYVNGNIGRAWYENVLFGSATGAGLCAFGNGLLFCDTGPGSYTSTGTIRYYNLQTGGVSSVGGTTATLTTPVNMCSARTFALASWSTGDGLLLFSSTTASTAKVWSSLYDFESSLTKLFRGITVDFVPGSNGNGGSVDIYYATGDVTGSPTLLQTGATSGTEYTFPGVLKDRAIQVQVVLNKGTSTLGPTLKRVYVRAAPQLQSYRKREYILDLTGAPEDAPRRLRDGTPDPTIPFDAITNLTSAAQSSTPISITDRLGTFTGIIEPAGFEIYEMHPEQQIPSKSGSYVVRVSVREV